MVNNKIFSNRRIAHNEFNLQSLLIEFKYIFIKTFYSTSFRALVLSDLNKISK